MLLGPAGFGQKLAGTAATVDNLYQENMSRIADWLCLEC